MLKDTNPKDAVGVRKWRQYCTVPTTIIWELGVAMLEGARKYGRHNYRVAGVRASVYIDAAKGHIDSWWEGEDVDADSGLSHVTKAMASLAVLRDAMINDMLTDDRPPKVKNFEAFRAGLGRVVDEIMERYPEAKEPFTELGQQAVAHVAVTPALDLAHAVGAVRILHPLNPDYDRERIFAGLTSKQMCRLIKAWAAQNGMDSDMQVYHSEFDEAALGLMSELNNQPLHEVRLDFESGGFRECKTLLTSEQWFVACPGVRVTEL